MAKKAKRGTANEAYAAAQREVKTELARIQRRLAEHAKAYARAPGNWGYVGDLTFLANTLKELLPDTQPGDRFTWKAGDVKILVPGEDE